MREGAQRSVTLLRLAAAYDAGSPRARSCQPCYRPARAGDAAGTSARAREYQGISAARSLAARSRSNSRADAPLQTALGFYPGLRTGPPILRASRHETQLAGNSAACSYGIASCLSRQGNTSRRSRVVSLGLGGLAEPLLEHGPLGRPQCSGSGGCRKAGANLGHGARA